jgi:Predicted aspartyl protease
MAEKPIQLGELKDNSEEEKESPRKELEKRILATSQMKEVPESLCYPKSEESISKDYMTQEQKKLSDDDSKSVKIKDCTENDLEVRLGYIGMGIQNKLEVPEAKTLLQVNGQIKGKAAKILLDTGCSTYVLSTQFATRHNIEGTLMKSRPVDLAVGSAKAQLTHKTGLLKIKIGETEVEKSLYLLPIQQFDAIVGMPFFIENEVDLSKLEIGIIEINGTKVRMKDNLNVNPEETRGDTEISTIAMISRKILKKELRCSRVDELYLAMIQEISEDEEGEGISLMSFENDKIPEWIENEYGTYFEKDYHQEYLLLEQWIIKFHLKRYASTIQEHFSTFTARVKRAEKTTRSTSKRWEN